MLNFVHLKMYQLAIYNYKIIEMWIFICISIKGLGMAWQEVKVKVKTAMNSAEQVASMIQPVILTPRWWFCPEFEDYTFLQV